MLVSNHITYRHTYDYDGRHRGRVWRGYEAAIAMAALHVEIVDGRRRGSGGDAFRVDSRTVTRELAEDVLGVSGRQYVNGRALLIMARVVRLDAPGGVMRWQVDDMGLIVRKLDRARRSALMVPEAFRGWLPACRLS